jgi:2,3-bisphosphoglycerate-dependent phosphoglycerate mutase
MNTVFLVRHGESWANAGFATPDPVKVELTPLGGKQAEEVATFLKKHTHLNLIVHSSYLRTKQTAESTKKLFPSTTMEEWEVQEFTYLSSVHRECSTVHDRKPLVEIYWTISEPSLIDSSCSYFTLNPQSESFKFFIWRVQAFIRKLKEFEDRCQNFVVFNHEQFIAAALWCIEREPTPTELSSSDSMRDFRDFFYQHRLPNGGIVELKVRHNQEMLLKEVITTHLTHGCEHPLHTVPDTEPPVSLECEFEGHTKFLQYKVRSPLTTHCLR